MVIHKIVNNKHHHKDELTEDQGIVHIKACGNYIAEVDVQAPYENKGIKIELINN